MHTTVFQRGVSAMALFASLAVCGSVVDAAGVIRVKTTVPAAGPNSTAQLVIYDDSGTQEVSGFAFKVYYKKSQATLTGVSGTDKISNSEVEILENLERAVEPGSPQEAAGFTHYKVVEATTGVYWEDVGDLATLTFVLNSTNLAGKIDVDVQPYPESDISTPGMDWYVDDNVQPIGATYQGAAASYGTAQINSTDYEGIYAGHGDLNIVIAGNSFYDGDEPGEPTTQVYLNGTPITVTGITETMIAATIPAALLQSVSGLYEDLPLAVSNDGVDIASEDSVDFTLVSRSVVYTDDDAFDSFGENKRVAPGKIKGSNAFETIQGGVNAVLPAGKVEVAAGIYPENISITKADITVEGAGDTASFVTSNSAAYHQILINLNAAGVKISDLGFTLSEYVGAAIRARGNDIEVSDCDFHVTGKAEVETNRGPLAAPNFPKDWGTQGIAYYGANANAITVKSNTFRASISEPIALARSILLMNAANAVVGGETVAEGNISGQGVAYRDLDMRYGSFGDVKNNSFATNVDVNDSAGPVVLEKNTFGNGADWLSNEAALTIRSVTDTNASVLVNDNDFLQTARGVWVGGCPVPVTISDNLFQPADSISAANLILNDLATLPKYAELQLRDDEYAHILIDTRLTSSEGYNSTNVTVSNNDFYDSAANGNAIQIKDLGSINTPTVNETMTLAFDNNRFHALSSAADNFVKLDASFSGTVNMHSNGNRVAAMSGDIVADADSNLDDLFYLEDHTFHQLDANGTGLVRWVDKHIYVTDLSDKIQRGVDAAVAGDTIRVQPAVYAEARSIGAGGYFGLVIDKKVRLIGPNYTIPGVGTRGAEALIIPGARLNAAATANPGPRVSDYHPVVYISSAANEAEFVGFEISGENDDLVDAEGPQEIGGLFLSAATGIWSTADSVKITHNKIKNLSYMGIWASARANDAASHNYDLTVQHNLVANVHSNDGYGTAYYMQGASGNVSFNHAQNVRSAMLIQPYRSTEPIVCEGNVLQAWKQGLVYNGNYTAPQSTLLSNIVTACAPPANTANPAHDTFWDGIMVINMSTGSDGGKFVGSTVNGAGSALNESYGIRLASGVNWDFLEFEGGSISNVNYGFHATSNGGANIHGGVEIHNTDIGVSIAAGNAVHAITGNNIHDNGIGIQVRNGGRVQLEDNQLVRNPVQLSFETTAANDSVVNGFNMNLKAPVDLETVVAENDLTGKTYLSTGMDALVSVLAETVGAEQYVNVRNTIGGSIAAAPANNAVQVLGGVYREVNNVEKTIRLTGRGHGVTNIQTPDISNFHSALKLSASGIIVENFGIYRDNLNPNAWPVLYEPLPGEVLVLQGVHMQHQSDCLVQNNEIGGFFSGVYFNSAPNNDVIGNRLSDNRYGVQFANNCSGNEIRNNIITGNWIAGLLFNFDGPTPNTTVGSIIVRSNNISGNWKSEVDCHWDNSQTILDLSGNWFGTTSVAATHVEWANADDVHYGWGKPAAPAPGFTPERIIGGRSEGLLDYNAWLASATEAPGADPNDLAFEGDFSTLYIASASPLTDGGAAEGSHISDAVKLLENGDRSNGARQILAVNGTYSDKVANVNKPVTIKSVSGQATNVIFVPENAAQNGIEVASHDVTIEDITMGSLTSGFATAINRVTGPWNNTVLRRVTVSNSGVSPSVSPASAGAYAVVLGQPFNSANSTGNVVDDCKFLGNRYAALALLGGVTNLENSHFIGNTYQGVYAAPDGNSDGGTRPHVGLVNNTFDTNAIGVRLNTVASTSFIGTSTQPNFFTLGVTAPGMGISVEHAPVTVENNTFTFGNQTVTDDTYGTLFSVGAYVFNTEATFTNNRLLGPSDGIDSSPAMGLVAVGQRPPILANPGAPSSNTSNNTKLTVNGGEIRRLNVGVAVLNAQDGDTATGDHTVRASIGGTPAISISDNETGVLVNGVNADVDIAASWIINNDTGIHLKKAAAGSSISNVTFTRIEPRNQLSIINHSGNDYSLTTGNSFDGVTVASASDVQLWAIQDNNLEDALDATDNGHLILKDNHVYVPISKLGTDFPANNGLITRANLVSKNGDRIMLQNGTYNDAMAKLSHFVTLVPQTAYEVKMAQTVEAELPAGTGTLQVENLEFILSGSLAILDANRNATSGYLVQKNRFQGLSSASTAITVDRVTASGTIFDNDIVNSGAGILLRNTKNATVEENRLNNNFGTGIEVTKSPIAGGGPESGGIVGTGLTIKENVIVGSGRPKAGLTDVEKGTNGDVPGTLESGKAYGIFAGLTGAAGPSVTDMTIHLNTVTGNAASGIALWYADGQDASNQGIKLTQNTVEENGIWRRGEPRATYGQNVDGVKLRHSRNVLVSHNIIRKNVRNNLHIEGPITTTGNGIKIAFNHLDSNELLVQNAGEPASFGGGLGLQIGSAAAPFTGVIDVNDNWWGHVYGPEYSANPTGRGSKILFINGGTTAASVDVTDWYGQRSETMKWFAVNDRDGDGVLDAHEDLDLSGNGTAPLWGTESGLTVKDSDNDGYEDGAEVECGSNPNDANSTPLNPGPGIEVHEWASFAHYRTPGPVTDDTVYNLNDEDDDRYLDFYEVGQGKDPDDPGSKPALGIVKTAVLDLENVWQQNTEANGAQITALRRLLTGVDSFKDTTKDNLGNYVVQQDNGDVNRDGVVNNADLIYLRRFVATTTPAFPVVLPAPSN